MLYTGQYDIDGGLAFSILLCMGERLAHFVTWSSEAHLQYRGKCGFGIEVVVLHEWRDIARPLRVYTSVHRGSCEKRRILS